MKLDEAMMELQKAPLYFEARTARAYINARGYCEYCGHELIQDRLGYASAQIDHLLPQGKFPYEITGREENFVLSCSLCNGIKRDAVVLIDDEDPLVMLSSQRAELVDRSRKLIEKRLESANEKWACVKAIFSGLDI